ncbi:protein abrupt-like isoform X2 [Photinus pyralis]|uniref:protein abrupt-like isoform X2 n=1 Tax=Photinus pyralis TaxID=7054 RepID=UPI001266F58C|nr:protein abrupt-like isoform X2 [Photinus pyralis]
MMSTEQFSLRWNNFHSNLTSGFHDLMQANDMVDVTLAVDGQFLQAHKLVLSICSPLFKQLFKINPCKHPVIILRDVTYENLKDILAFMYLGEVNVLRDNLSTFLRTAELLQVKGLTSDDSSDTSSKKDDKSDTTCDNDMEQDIHQFNTMMASSDLEPISYTPSPQPHSVKRTSQNISGQSKRSKSDQTSTSIIEKQERFDSPIQIEEDGEYMENTNFEPYPCEGEEVSSNREAIKQFLECNNVNVLSTQDSSSQDHDVLLYSGDPKGHVYCPYCYRKFVNRYNLKVHIRDKHDNNPINLDCIVCGKTMRNRSCLRVHLYHHRKQQLQSETSGA